MELKATLLFQKVSHMTVVQRFLVINLQLIQNKDLLKLLTWIILLGIRSVHECKTERLQCIAVLFYFVPLLKLINLLFLLYQWIVLHIQHLLLSILLQNDYFIGVLLAFSNNAFFVNEGKNCDWGDLCYDVIAGDYSFDEKLPESRKVFVTDWSVLEICFLIEAIGLDFGSSMFFVFTLMDPLLSLFYLSWLCLQFFPEAAKAFDPLILLSFYSFHTTWVLLMIFPTIYLAVKLFVVIRYLKNIKEGIHETTRPGLRYLVNQGYKEVHRCQN